VHGSIDTEGKNSTREGMEKIVRWQCRDRLRWGPRLLHGVGMGGSGLRELDRWDPKPARLEKKLNAMY
ncbi:hypothetical protein A2U01_0054475, partial [Trifolium medium]|nr:hypothetical protein [Trifolium medium]